MAEFDAILIPGGGLTATGVLLPFVRARLDRALMHSADCYIPLSAGSPHIPPPLDARGYPILESIPAAEYLRERGIPQQQILAETLSYDTIGNAYFTRTVHTGPCGFRRLLIVTSHFHMPRTEAIFRWVFGALPDDGYDLSFESTDDASLSSEALDARMEKERAGIESVRRRAASITTLADLHRWLFTEHGAYAWPLRDSAYRPVRGALMESYGGAR